MAVVFGSRGPSVTSSSSSFFHFPPAIRPSTPAPPVPSSPESLSVIGNVHRVAKTQLYNRPLEAHAESAYHPLFERIQSFLHDVAACAPPFGRARPSPTPILRLLGVPPTAVDLIRRHLEALTYGPLSSSVAKGVKMDYDFATGTLAIISCPSWEHEHMARIDLELLNLLSHDNSTFSGNNPNYRIVSGGTTSIPLPGLPGTPSSQRQPDGSLRLLRMKDNPPFLVWEILDTQPLHRMNQKVREYFMGTDGKIRIVIILQLLRQPPPPKARKRKRGQASLGESGRVAPLAPPDGDIPNCAARDLQLQDTIDLAVTCELEENDPALLVASDDPVAALASIPLPGTVVRGVFWVYTLQMTTSTGISDIHCIENGQEFYPARPTGALSLTWSHVLGAASVPPELHGKTLQIPYDLFYDKLRELLLPDVVAPGDAVVRWGSVAVSEIALCAEDSDAGSESTAQSEGDASFVSVAVPAEEGAERRSARLAVREGRTG